MQFSERKKLPLSGKSLNFSQKNDKSLENYSNFLKQMICGHFSSKMEPCVCFQKLNRKKKRIYVQETVVPFCGKLHYFPVNNRNWKILHSR